MSHRVAQVESLIKRAVSQLLVRNDLGDPRIAGLISVTKVKVSPDLHDAYVWVSVLPEQYESRVIAALKHATRHIQAQIKKQIALPNMPHLDFRLDESIKKQAEIDAAIRRGQDAGESGDNAQPGQDESSASPDSESHQSPEGENR